MFPQIFFSLQTVSRKPWQLLNFLTYIRSYARRLNGYAFTILILYDCLQIRQIVGKQSRLSIKSMKVNNTNNELDSSTNSTTSTATIELENPFATNRTLVRSSTKENNSSTRELNVTFEKPKTPEKAKTQNFDEKENQPFSRSEIPRTPQAEDLNSQKGKFLEQYVSK